MEEGVRFLTPMPPELALMIKIGKGLPAGTSPEVTSIRDLIRKNPKVYWEQRNRLVEEWQATERVAWAARDKEAKLELARLGGAQEEVKLEADPGSDRLQELINELLGKLRNR